MPTYEYECEVCGYRFERFHKMDEEPWKECPQCGGAVRRLISSAAVILKGGASSAPAGEESATRCGRERPCCGREVPCGAPPCGS